MLSTLVAKVTDRLKVQDGRLVTKTEARGETFYHELSTGGAQIAVPIAVRSIGEGGLLCLSQEAWQGADPQLRDDIQRLAIEHNTTIYTAEVSGDEELQGRAVRRSGHRVGRAGGARMGSPFPPCKACCGAAWRVHPPPPPGTF